MTFNKSPRNAAVDNYVINTNRGFRWRLICSFDHLLGNWQSLVFLTRSLQILKGVKPLRMPARMCLHQRLHLYTCMCYIQTHTHEYMHTQILEYSDVCFHRHQADSGILNPIMPFIGVTQKPVGMVAVMAERVCQPGWSYSRSLRHCYQFSDPRWLH